VPAMPPLSPYSDFTTLVLNEKIDDLSSEKNNLQRDFEIWPSENTKNTNLAGFRLDIKDVVS
jgi:hypothetical protein